MRTILAMILLAILTGCAAAPSQHGIKNFSKVEPGVYRGGEPPLEGRRYLKSIGVEMELKLNSGIVDFPVVLHRDTISFWRQIGFGTITDDEINRDIEFMRCGPVFVHCTHGQDRTGLVIACYRVRVDGWSKTRAEREMLAHGFHKSLCGLWRYWKDFQP